MGSLSIFRETYMEPLSLSHVGGSHESQVLARLFVLVWKRCRSSDEHHATLTPYPEPLNPSDP